MTDLLLREVLASWLISPDASLAVLERLAIEAAMNMGQQSQKVAAGLLKVSPRVLNHKLGKLKLRKIDQRAERV